MFINNNNYTHTVFLSPFYSLKLRKLPPLQTLACLGTKVYASISGLFIQQYLLSGYVKALWSVPGL